MNSEVRGVLVVEAANSQIEPGAVNRRAGRQDVCAVILSGGLRPSPLIQATACATLDLLISREGSVLDRWLDRLGSVLDAACVISVVPSRSCPRPRIGDSWASLVPEPDAYRGPAGVIRDVAINESAGTILVMEAARYLDGSLEALLDRHERSGARATVGENPDGSPAGVYALDRGVLDLVPMRGFMDLKEQLLPKICEAGSVEVVVIEGGTLALQTPRDFLHAAAWIATGPDATTSGIGVWWTPEDRGWKVVAPDASVHGDAQVAASVVHARATIEEGSLVARSIVCEGARVREGQRVIDQVVLGDRDGRHIEAERMP